MAYAEKRGKGPQAWRVKYKLPSGGEASESGFETKAAALAWGRDQEARIREGRWTDPNAGKTTVSEWINRWLAIQDVGISTQDNREYLIRRFIRPAWGASELNSLSTGGITRWENALPARAGISARTARAARTLLGTILGDAAATRPPLIPYNPALRPRNRGRRTGRRLERDPQRAWATPLQALLLAERAALMSGRDNDFTTIVTIAYTGMRWGETIGLECDYLRLGEIHVEWQLRELNGKFHRLPPKDDFYRSPKWEPKLPIDLPRFLEDLITRQASQDHPGRRCACAGEHGGSGQYLFLGPDGGHYRRSNYARRVFRPACDGRHEAANGQPAKVVIADTTAWPGVPVAAWPPAQPSTGADPASADLASSYAPPRGPGNPGHPSKYTARLLAADPAWPDRSWLEAQPQDLDGRGRHPGDPRRAATRPPGARDARPVRPRLASDARRPDRRSPSPMGRIPQRPRGYLPALTRAATRRTTGTAARRDQGISRASDTRKDAPTAAGTGRQGEVDLPNSSQPPKGPALPTRVDPALRASDLARYQDRLSGAKGTRTPDPLLAKQVLFQLSYSPRCAHRLPAVR